MTKQLTQDVHINPCTVFESIDAVQGYLDDHPDFAADDCTYTPVTVRDGSGAIMVFDEDGFQLGLL